MENRYDYNSQNTGGDCSSSDYEASGAEDESLVTNKKRRTSILHLARKSNIKMCLISH